MSKAKDGSDFRIRAASPVYLVLCRDGTPHPGCYPRMSLIGADQEKRELSDPISLKCGPHRVQAYRPML